MRLTDAETERARSLPVAELHAWGLLVVGLAYWGNVVRTARHGDAGGLGFVLDSVVQNGAFALAAWALAAWALAAADALRPGPARTASPAQLAVTLGACLLSVFAARQATILALVTMGAQLSRSGPSGSARLAPALLFALALDMAWTSTYAMPLHTAAALLDARTVARLLHALGGAEAAGDNLVTNGAAGFGIEILARCASSYPLAGVWLAYVVVLAYQGRLPRRADRAWVVASLAASVALTEARLCWMAAREEDFAWLHDGGGMTLYALAATACAVAFPMLATRAASSGRAA